MKNTLITTLFVIAASTAQAQFTFQKVVDSNTVVPPGTGTATFEDISWTSPVIDQGQVAFVAFNLGGVYLFNGTTISELASRDQTLPGVSTDYTIQHFDNDISIEVTAGVATVAFEAVVDLVTNDDVREAVLTSTNGVLTNRYDTFSSLSPSTGTVFDEVDEPSLFGGVLVFRGRAQDSGGTNVEGVYTDASGSLAVVVDTNSSVPGQPDTSFFTGFDVNIGLGGSGIGIEATFQVDAGSSSSEMLLLATPTGLTVVADTVNTLSPSTGVLFDVINEASVDGTGVVFFGEDTNGFQGIYADFGAGLVLIADQNTAAPGQGAALLTEFDNDDLTLSGGRVLFETGFDGGEGVYLWEDGVLTRVIDTTQLLDGKQIESIDLSFDGGISGDQVVFSVGFADDTRGIYIATIPEPASLALLGLGGLIVTLRRRQPRSGR